GRRHTEPSSLHTPGPPAAEQRDGICCFNEAGGLDLVAFKTDQHKWIREILNPVANQCLGALVHESGIGAVDKNDRRRPIRASQKILNLSCLDRNHVVAAAQIRSYAPAMK